MQLVNHKCEDNSNCSARVIDLTTTRGGLDSSSWRLSVILRLESSCPSITVETSFIGMFRVLSPPRGIIVFDVRVVIMQSAPITLSALKIPLASCFYPQDPLTTMRLVARRIGPGRPDLPLLIVLAR
jgi:hypothetical protein